MGTVPKKASNLAGDQVNGDGDARSNNNIVRVVATTAMTATNTIVHVITAMVQPPRYRANRS
jgi:hypothetical protein